MTEPQKDQPDIARFAYVAFAFAACMVLRRLYQRCHPFYLAYKSELLSVLGLVLFFVVLERLAVLWNYYQDRWVYDRSVTGPDARAVRLGKTPKGKTIYLKESARTLHAQVIGTTSAGKTESVILPWAITDIEKGSGLLIIDGKADQRFLDKLYAYVVKSNREKDFRLFSLAHPGPSTPFNPLLGGTPHEATERVFSALTFENEYYRGVQYKIFSALIQLVSAAGEVPTFRLVQRLLTDPALLAEWMSAAASPALTRQLGSFVALSQDKRQELISGLDAQLSQFLSPEMEPLFNATSGTIRLDEALEKGQICYFQLPTMYAPTVAATAGRLVLQSFQSAVARRHMALGSGGASASGEKNPPFFSLMLDDFQDYIYPGFGSLLNKSRSAGIGVVFSHQALGDLDKVGPDFRNTVMTNTNVKVVMRTLDPDTSDFFAKALGTKSAEKVTVRQKWQWGTGQQKTGEGSVREVEEFNHHPNEIKNLALGQGIVTVPHPKGVKTFNIRFDMRPDLPAVALPEVPKTALFEDDFQTPRDHRAAPKRMKRLD